MPYPSKLLHHHQRNRRPHHQWRVIQLTLSSYSAYIHSIRPNFIIYCTPPNKIHSIGENFWNKASVEEAYKKKDHYRVSMSTSRPKSQAKRLLGNVFKTIRWFVLNTPVPDPGSCTSMLKGAVKKSWSSAVYRLPPRPWSYPTWCMFLGHFTPNTWLWILCTIYPRGRCLRIRWGFDRGEVGGECEGYSSECIG